MPRCRKRFIALLVLIILPGLYLVEEHYRGKWMLASWLKHAQEKGERFDVDAFAHNGTPAEKNRTSGLLTAASGLTIGRAMLAANSQVYAAPGKLICPLFLEDWYDILKSGRTTNLGWQLAEAEIRTNAPRLATIQAAIRQGALDFNLDYRQGFNMSLSHLPPLKPASQSLAALALVELHAGHRDEALTALLDAITFAKAQVNEPIVFLDLEGDTSIVTALNATWQALQSPGWTDSQLAQLQKAWENASSAQAMLNAQVMTRAAIHLEFGFCRENPKKLTDMLTGARGSRNLKPGTLWAMIDPIVGPARATIRENVYGPLWSYAWAYQDELRFLQLAEVVLDQTRQAVARKSWAGVSFPPYNDGSIHSEQGVRSVRYPLSGWIPFIIFSNWTLNLFHTESYREMAVTATALRRYQLQHGQYPATLSALVPQYLSQLPIDYMDGQPLRYRLKEDGTFLLYSIGENLKDDGGDPTITNQTNRPAYMNARDNCWPSPATENEIAILKNSKTKKP